MARKRTPKKTTKKPSQKRIRKAKKPEDILDQRIKHFGDEVEKLGERFGKRMERKGEEWDSWFHRTFGIVGPLISSIFGLVVLSLIVWFIGIVNIPIGSRFVADIYNFLLENIGLFFLIFMLFSYTSYFSRAFQRAYRPFSPLVAAAGVAIVFWIAMHALDIVSLHIGNLFVSSVFSEIAFFIGENLFWIFGVVLVVGYIALSVKIATERPGERLIHDVEERIIMKKGSPRVRKTKRIYRSGRDRILGGVCGGISEYLGVDPVLIRLLWVIMTLAWGFGLVLYLIAWIIIPRNPNHKWD